MSIAELERPGLWVPRFRTANTTSESTETLDAADEKLAMMVQVWKTGNITKMSFWCKGFTSSATMLGSIETIDGSGDPSGTLFAANADGSILVNATGFYEIAFTDPVPVTIGDEFMVVLAQPSVSAGSMEVGVSRTFEVMGSPYNDLFTGTWAKQTELPSFGLKYDDGEWYHSPIVEPTANLGTTVFANTSTPDERGNIYLGFPFPARVIGAWAHLDLDNAADLVFYNNAGTAELTKSLVAANRRTSGFAASVYAFPGTADIAAGDSVRLVLKPTTTSTVGLTHIDVNDAAYMGGFELGVKLISTSRVDAGSWTNLATRRHNMGLILSGAEVGGGGGGGMIVHPGMTGGMRG